MKIKNLRFGKNKIPKKVKLIKNKIRVKISAVALATIVAFSGCANFFRPINNYNEINRETSSTIYDNNDTSATNNLIYDYNNNDIGYDYEENIDYNNIFAKNIINFDKDNIFHNYINSYKIDYDFIEYYNIDKLMKKNIETIDINYVVWENSIKTPKQLYNIVIKNNKTFINKSNNKIFYKEFNKNKLKKICTIIMNSINSYINSENESEVYQVLNDLKILSKNSINNGFVSDHNVLALSENKVLNNNNLEECVVHESIHLIQKNSKENIEDGSKRIGVCTVWTDENINSLNWTWFYEASASKCMENLLNTASESYKYDIDILNMIKFTTILNSNTHTELEEICNNKDINRLYEFFNCTNELEKKELIAFMYSIEIIQNKPKEIVEIIKNDDLNYLNILKTDIYTNITKYFYKNLDVGIKNNNMTINDVFTLINLFESCINYNLVTNYEGNFQKNKDFMEFYSEIQNQFFYQLATSLDINFSTIYDAYVDYIINEKKTAINIDSLKNDTNSWLNEQVKKYSSYSTSIIQEDYFIFLNKFKKK